MRQLREWCALKLLRLSIRIWPWGQGATWKDDYVSNSESSAKFTSTLEDATDRAIIESRRNEAGISHEEVKNLMKKKEA